MIGTDAFHSIQVRNGKRVVVCNGHFCDMDSLTEYQYYQKVRADKKGESS